MKRKLSLTALLLLLWWLAGEGDKRVQARYQAIKQADATGEDGVGQRLAGLRREGN